MQTARTTRHRGPPARDEAGHRDELAAALVQLPVRPLEGLLALLAVKEPLPRRGTEAVADQVTEIVPEEGTYGCGEDDQLKIHPAARRDDAGRDD